jgi:isopenicillin N synthase-like dioxygenase
MLPAARKLSPSSSNTQCIKSGECVTACLARGVPHRSFFYVSNFGISQEEVDYQFEISQQFFDGLSLEEKLRYKADHSKFSYNGYNGPAVFECVAVFQCEK